MKDHSLILGIETSCDETAAAVLKIIDRHSEQSEESLTNVGSRIRERSLDKLGMTAEVLSNVIFSQTDIHAKFGGVFPDLAARAHAQKMLSVLEDATEQAKTSMDDIDAVAVTVGPGLIGSLLVGTAAAQAISYSYKKPLYAVNHLEGHIYTALGSGEIKDQRSKVKDNSKFYIVNSTFPCLALIVSGGHTQLVLVKKPLEYEIIGTTRDDAAGEAFDKVARIMGLEYPGGPKIQALAEKGNPKAFDFPRGMINSKDLNFSFSGLKTAVIYQISKLTTATPGVAAGGVNLAKGGNIWHDEYKLTNSQKANVAASFQAAVVDVLVAKTIQAARRYNVKNITAGGGVVANGPLREKLTAACRKNELDLYLPPISLTTDNAVGIALAGAVHERFGQPTSWQKIEATASLKLGN